MNAMAWTKGLGTVLVAGGALWALSATVQAAERVALVIGNSDYEKPSVPFLANPRNDAQAMGEALAHLGFAVTLLEDASYQDLRLGLQKFEKAVARSEIAVVFYAGHGIEMDKHNYLVPVDAALASDRDVKHEAMKLSRVLESVEGASRLRLVILDACRNNPFEASMQRTAGTTRSVKRGLARVEPSMGTLVAYAAKEGTTADDEGGKGHSPFTEALLARIETPGLEVWDMFRDVADAVWASTGQNQLPFTYGSVPRNTFYLAGKGPSDPVEDPEDKTPPPPPPGGAKEAYEEAKEVGNVAAMLAVVKRFPGTFEADLAQAWIDKHEPLVVAGGDDVEEAPPVVTPPPPSPEAVEQGLGLSREEHRLVQRGLAAAGHDPGPADGMIGRGTREAIRRWQGTRGEPATGYLDADGAKALLALGEREAERRRADAARERKAKEAEAAALRARKEAERKAREAEERRLAEAERRADDEAFARARRLHTESGYRAYLARGGRHEAEARALLSKVTEPRWDVGEKFRDCPGCPEMVVVPEGSFLMGSPESEAGRYDDGREGPVHPVTFVRPFAVGVHEVTVGEFARFVSATGRSMGNACWMWDGEWKERSGRHWRSPGFSQTDDHPVVCVDWNDAKAYVRWLSGETGEAYRLPSEAEWEYVARAGTMTAWYWGERESGQCRYANGADEASGDLGGGKARCNDGHARTSPVGSYEANGYGLHDVLGNVWEWVEDCWNGSYAGAPRGGSAWMSGDCGRRVLRGGSWGGIPRYLRSAYRDWYTTGNRNSFIGFRVARTLTP